MNDRPPIPIHIVAGPLGVGKTTAILSYVERQAGLEHVAVLVNDFGPVGMDGAIMQGAIGQVVGDQMKVLTIPGGCLCCASADALASGLPKLVSLPGISRIIIEPSGIAMPAQVVDLVRSLADRLNLDVRPTIVMLDAAEFRSELAERMPYYQRLVEAADVLVGNRCDRASDAAIDRFRSWADTLDPPKLRVITTTQGELPDAVFALSGASKSHAMPSHAGHAHHHSHDETDATRTSGRTWPPEAVFRLTALREVLRDTTAERLKGIFHTDAGWKLIQRASGECTERFTEHRRDSRADWILPAGPTAETEANRLGDRLDRCRIDQG